MHISELRPSPGTAYELRDNARGSELSEQTEEHLIRSLHAPEPCTTQLAAIAKHVVIPTENKVGELPVVHLQNVRLCQTVVPGQFAPGWLIIFEHLLK